MSVDIIGTIYTAGEYDEEDIVIVAPEPLPGWHVITTSKLSGLDAYLSEAEPPRVFAGAKTHYYVFEAEEQTRELIGTDEEGNLTPTFDQPVTVPKLVTMRQAKLALIEVGLLDAVDAAIDAIPDATARKKAQIEWEYAQEVRRDWPLLNAVAAQMGMTGEQVDGLFNLAATL